MTGKTQMPQASSLAKPSCMAYTSYFLFISSHGFCQLFSGSCTPPTPSSRCFMCFVFMTWWSPLIKWKVSSWNSSAHHSTRLLGNGGIFHYLPNYLKHPTLKPFSQLCFRLKGDGGEGSSLEENVTSQGWWWSWWWSTNLGSEHYQPERRLPY